MARNWLRQQLGRTVERGTFVLYNDDFRVRWCEMEYGMVAIRTRLVLANAHS